MTKQRGTINLVRLFQSEAMELLSAVERGQILHATKNIRESGSQLETSFRSFLRSKLPDVYRVLTGYLFDVDSLCTPQIDTIIIGGDECHELMTSADGASYVPFVGALALFEVKNTTYDVDVSLNQMSAILNTIEKMRAPVLQQAVTSAQLPDPISVVFFGNSSGSKLREIQAWYSAHKRADAPTYTVLLDRGVIIAFQNFAETFFEYDEPQPLGLEDHKNRGEACLCAPRVRDEFVRGRALLWLYLAIADHLSKTSAKQGHILAFTHQALSTYALDKIAPLANVADWDAYDKLLQS
jgi:hypothetical protein